MAHLNELMSITKGAIGLAFAETDIDWNRVPFLVLDPSSGTQAGGISVRDALNHNTGVEDDELFDWKEFLVQAKQDGLLRYCIEVFLQKLSRQKKGRRFIDANTLLSKNLYN